MPYSPIHAAATNADVDALRRLSEETAERKQGYFGEPSSYLRKVRAAGGIRAYERTHLNAIAATFIPKLPLLPPEMVRRVVEYAFHVGDS